jgi:hypothetical protein
MAEGEETPEVSCCTGAPVALNSEMLLLPELTTQMLPGAAVDLLERAIALDPQFPLAHLQLSNALTVLGQEVHRDHGQKRHPAAHQPDEFGDANDVRPAAWSDDGC